MESQEQEENIHNDDCNDKKYKHPLIRLELGLDKYQNIVNLLFTIIGFSFTIISVVIAIYSLRESKKAYDLVTNGSNLKVSLATEETYKDDNNWIQYKYHHAGEDGVILSNEFSGRGFTIDNVNFSSVGTGIINIFIKNTGYAPAKDVSLKLSYENIITRPYTAKSQNKVVENSEGWKFRDSDFYGRGTVHGSEGKIEKVYKAQYWNSNYEDIIIYPGETYKIQLNVWGDEELYMLGKEGKIKLSITSSNSVYKEKEFTIKK